MLLLLLRSPLAAMPRYVLSQGIVASLPVFSSKNQAINQKGFCGTRDPVANGYSSAPSVDFFVKPGYIGYIGYIGVILGYWKLKWKLLHCNRVYIG